MTGPSRHPKHATPATPQHTVEAPPVVRRPPAAPSTPPRPRERPRRPQSPVPDLPNAVPKAPNVCALGRRYGGWRADSPEAEICERTYGH